MMSRLSTCSGFYVEGEGSRGLPTTLNDDELIV